MKIVVEVPDDARQIIITTGNLDTFYKIYDKEQLQSMRVKTPQETLEDILGGKMRNMTEEEQEMFEKSIEDMSVPTGKNLFDELDSEVSK